MPKQKLPPEFITPTEAGKLIGKGATGIQNAICNGTFPVGKAFKCGGDNSRWSYRINRQELYKAFRPDLLK